MFMMDIEEIKATIVRCVSQANSSLSSDRIADTLRYLQQGYEFFFKYEDKFSSQDRVFLRNNFKRVIKSLIEIFVNTGLNAVMNKNTKKPKEYFDKVRVLLDFYKSVFSPEDIKEIQLSLRNLIETSISQMIRQGLSSFELGSKRIANAQSFYEVSFSSLEHYKASGFADSRRVGVMSTSLEMLKREIEDRKARI